MNPPQPIIVVTSWGAFGAALLAALLVAVSFAAVSYWHVIRRPHPLPLRWLLAIVVAALAVAWCSPVLFSSDVYSYAAYGEMARIGLNPYAQAPAHTNDLLVRAAQWQWRTAFPICLYGPAFVALARAIVGAFARAGMLAQLDALRLAASGAFALCVLLAYGAFRGDRAARLRAAATIGLNPAAIWCAAEGHNDAIALAVTLAGFVLVRRRLTGWGAALAGLSALIKPPGALAALALAVVNRRAGAGALAGIAIVLLLSFGLIAGVTAQLAPHGAYAPQASLQAIFAPLGPVVALSIAGIAGAALAARGVALLRRGHDEGWVWLGLSAWVLVPNPYPWYALWLIAVAALAPQSRAGVTAILLSFTSLLRYAPDAVGTPGAAVAVLLGLAAASPLLVVALPGYNERPS